MRNKEDKSNIWDQEVLHKLMTMSSKYIKKYRTIYTICRVRAMTKVSRELSQTMLTRRTQGT